MNPAVLDDVSAYWFGPLEGPESVPPRQAFWFGQSDETDRTIRERFGRFVAEAGAATFDLDALTRTQGVGLVVLLDQFPRNMHRQSGEAFAFDDKARAITDHLLRRGNARYHHVERAFLFLPVMHHEDVASQDSCVLLYAEQAVSAPAALKEMWRAGLDFATKHRDLIRKFGRFPHRNAMLGRKSTPEEEAFLAQHGRGF